MSHNFILGQLLTVWLAWENHWCSFKKFMISFLVLWDYYCEVLIHKKHWNSSRTPTSLKTATVKTLFISPLELKGYLLMTRKRGIAVF